MNDATNTLIAAPAVLADTLRAAASQWDSGSNTMFRSETLRSKADPSALFVFAWGVVANNILPLLQEAATKFSGVQILFSYSFEDALDQAGLERVPVTPP